MKDRDIEDMKEVIEDGMKGSAVELLPSNEHAGITVGISVGVDATRNKDYESAAAAFETVARLIRKNHLQD